MREAKLSNGETARNMQARLNSKFAVNHVDFKIAGWEGCNFPVIVEASSGSVLPCYLTIMH